jgi:nitrite reductase/ring-hydroxylating ferredoxin subunit
MTDASRSGPDLALGVDADILVDGKLACHFGDDEVLLVRGDGGYFAVGAHCTHYNGPLCDGLVVGDTIRCPWHHASFDLRSGEAQRAPAFLPIRRWAVECAGGKVFVRGEISPAPAARLTNDDVAQIVIVGGGAAGFAAAEMLRRVGYANGIAMVSAEHAPPIDRPNLSKDYLAGSAREDWLPLRPAAFYADARIDLRLGTAVTGIDARARRVVASDGRELSYDRLLLATGAEPRRLSVAGAHLPHVRALRTLGDADAIIAGLAGARRAVVVGAGLMGLEAAASMRTRGLEVRVVTPHAGPWSGGGNLPADPA